MLEPFRSRCGSHRSRNLQMQQRLGLQFRSHFAHAKLDYWSGSLAGESNHCQNARAGNASFTSSYNRNCSNTTEWQLELADSTNELCKG